MTNLIPRTSLFNDIVRADPFTNLDDWFNTFWMRRPLSTTDSGDISPIRIDVNENDKAYTIRAEIPGVKKEDVKVRVDGNVVSISAETKQKKREKRKWKGCLQ